MLIGTKADEKLSVGLDEIRPGVAGELGLAGLPAPGLLKEMFSPFKFDNLLVAGCWALGCGDDTTGCGSEETLENEIPCLLRSCDPSCAAPV